MPRRPEDPAGGSPAMKTANTVVVATGKPAAKAAAKEAAEAKRLEVEKMMEQVAASMPSMGPGPSSGKGAVANAAMGWIDFPAVAAEQKKKGAGEGEAGGRSSTARAKGDTAF